MKRDYAPLLACIWLASVLAEPFAPLAPGWWAIAAMTAPLWLPFPLTLIALLLDAREER